MKKMFYVWLTLILFASIFTGCSQANEPSSPPAPPTYRVTYDVIGGKGQVPIDSKHYSAGQDVTIKYPDSTDLTKDGFVFVGWNDKNDSGTKYSKPDNPTFTISSNVTLYAQWIDEKIEYVVKLNYNGGEPVEKAITSLTNLSSELYGNVGKAITFPNLEISDTNGKYSIVEKPGYVFSDWNTEPDGTGRAYNNSRSFSEDVQLYIKWVKVHTVTYDANTGTGQVPDKSLTDKNEECIVEAPPDSLEKENFIFAGWNTEQNGSGTNYSEGKTLKVLVDTTLYAHWIKKDTTFTVTLDLNGGKLVEQTRTSLSTFPSTLSGTGGAKILFPNLENSNIKEKYFTVEKTGYVSSDWNTKPDGTGSDYNNSSFFSENVTVYIKWVKTHTVTYNANTGTGDVPIDKLAYITGSNVTVKKTNFENLTKESYIFAGWNTEPDGYGTNYSEGSTFTISSNITLYAKWSQNPNIIVTLNLNGGEWYDTKGINPPSELKGKAGAKIPFPILEKDNDGEKSLDLKKLGYVFSDWNTKPDGTGRDYRVDKDHNYFFSKNETVYVKWVKKYTVTYDKNDGTGQLVKQGITDEDQQIEEALPSLTKQDSVLFGWNTKADGTGITYFKGTRPKISSDITLYAKWVENTNEFSVSYELNGLTGLTGNPQPEFKSPGEPVTLADWKDVTKIELFVWNTKPDGTGTSYAPGSTYFPLGDVTLYAKKLDSHPITFNEGIGIDFSADITVYPNLPFSKGTLLLPKNPALYPGMVGSGKSLGDKDAQVYTLNFRTGGYGFSDKNTPSDWYTYFYTDRTISVTGYALTIPAGWHVLTDKNSTFSILPFSKELFLVKEPSGKIKNYVWP